MAAFSANAQESFNNTETLVAEDNHHIVGHALFSKAEVVDEENSHEVIVLAPIAVMPSHQRIGIGSKLVQEGLKRCTELSYDFTPNLGLNQRENMDLI